MAELLLPNVEIHEQHPAAAPPEAPDQIGSFPYEISRGGVENLSDFPGVVMIRSKKGGLTAPVEESTGMPLPVTHRYLMFNADRHHAYFYREHFAKGQLGQKAVRSSRLQKLNIYAHTVFHQNYDGLPLPTSKDDQYKLTILGLAGYIPQFGVKVSGGEANIVELTEGEKNRLRKPNAFLTENSGDINKFLVKYAYSQGFTEDEHKLIEEFLSLSTRRKRRDPVTRQRRWELGSKLTGRAIGFANEPFNQEYAQARRRQGLRIGAPVCAWLVVKKMLEGKEVGYYSMLEDHLSQYA